MSFMDQDIDPRSHLLTVRLRQRTAGALRYSRKNKAASDQRVAQTGGEDGSSNVIEGLFNKRQRHVAALLATLREMREEVNRVSDPTSVSNLRLIRTTQFVRLDRTFDRLHDKLDAAVEDIVVHWSEVEASTRRFRGSAYNPADYVGLPHSLRNIEVSLDVGQLPRKGMLAAELPTELLAKLNARYEKQRDEDVRTAHKNQVQRAVESVSKLVTVLTDRERIAGSVIDKVRDIVDNAESRRYLSDVDFEMFNKAVASVLRGVSNDTVKQDKRKIAADLKATVERFASVLG
jgi:hypothetical protein